MIKFIFKRIGYAAVTLWIIVTITFFLMNTIPGNPIMMEFKKSPPSVKQNLLHQYGFDKPLQEQYIIYLKNLLRGDLGRSMESPYLKASTILKETLPVSSRIGIQAIFVGLIFGLSFGIIAAFNRNTWIDHIVMFLAIIFLSFPQFVVVAIMLLTLGWTQLPMYGWAASDASWLVKFKYTILPTIALSFGSTAIYARFMRSSVLDIIDQDYIMLAKSKGLKKTQIVWKYILRNAMIPFITLIPPQIAAVFTGSFIVESMFSIPGIGAYFVACIYLRDYPMIMAITILTAALYIVSLLIVDILYVVVDPRIAITGTKR